MKWIKRILAVILYIFSFLIFHVLVKNKIDTWYNIGYIIMISIISLVIGSLEDKE